MYTIYKCVDIHRPIQHFKSHSLLVKPPFVAAEAEASTLLGLGQRVIFQWVTKRTLILIKLCS